MNKKGLDRAVVAEQELQKASDKYKMAMMVAYKTDLTDGPKTWDEAKDELNKCLRKKDRINISVADREKLHRLHDELGMAITAYFEAATPRLPMPDMRYAMLCL